MTVPIFIPDRIQILDKTYTVELDQTLHRTQAANGEILYEEQIIRLQPHSEVVPKHYQHTEYGFFHEIVHGILYAMGEGELRDNEKFVGAFARVMYQCLRDSGMLNYRPVYQERGKDELAEEGLRESFKSD